MRNPSAVPFSELGPHFCSGSLLDTGLLKETCSFSWLQLGKKSIDPSSIKSQHLLDFSYFPQHKRLQPRCIPLSQEFTTTNFVLFFSQLHCFPQSTDFIFTPKGRKTWLSIQTNLLFIPELWFFMKYRYLLRSSNARKLTLLLLRIILHPEGCS